MTVSERKRWRLTGNLLQAEAKDKVFEGIGKSLFMRVQEVVSQQIYTGTSDLMSMIGAGRLLTANTSQDYTGYLSRLPIPKNFDQVRGTYPISQLNPSSFSTLIGGKPGWTATINGNLVVPIGSIWGQNSITGEEYAYGRRQEATPFDGSVFAKPEALIMPVVEINGQLYVGGKVDNRPNMADQHPFTSPRFPINIQKFSDSQLATELEKSTGITGIVDKGIVRGLPHRIITCNPNSAHQVEGFYGYIVDIDPDKVIQTSPEQYQLIGGDPDFVFVPLNQAIDSPEGYSAATASALTTSGKIISLK